MVQKNAGWIHAETHVGTYASTYGVEYLLLDKRPTKAQFRRDDYQGLQGVNEIREPEKLALLASQTGRVIHRDIPYREYNCFNMDRIVATEQRLAQAGWPKRFFDDPEMIVSDSINCTGRIDSVVIFPDEYITKFEVMRNGACALRVQQTEEFRGHCISPMLIVFDSDRVEHVEIACHSSQKPEWLSVECNVEVEYL